jgi:hypothetical protein
MQLADEDGDGLGEGEGEAAGADDDAPGDGTGEIVGTVPDGSGTGRVIADPDGAGTVLPGGLELLPWPRAPGPAEPFPPGADGECGRPA